MGDWVYEMSNKLTHTDVNDSSLLIPEAIF